MGWLLTLIVYAGQSQNPLFTNIAINHPGIEVISGIAQDSCGIMWLATNKGLLSYDGSGVEINSGVSISSPITFFSIVGGNRILIGCKDGAFYECRISFRKLALTDSAQTGAEIKKVIEQDKQTYIATYGAGILIKSNKSLTRIGSKNGLCDDYVNDLTIFDNHLLIATDGGACRMNLQTRKIQSYDNIDLAQSGIKFFAAWIEKKVCAITENDGMYWLNTDSENFEKDTLTSIWNYGNVRCIADNPNELLISTTANVLIDYHKSNHLNERLYHSQTGFKFNAPQFVFKDAQQGIWMAVANKLYYSPGEMYEKLTSIDGTPIGEILALAVAKGGDVFFASRNGIYHLDIRTRHAKQLTDIVIPKNILQNISCLTLQDHLLFIGTLSDIFYTYNLDTRKQQAYASGTEIENAGTLHIAATDDYVWAATLSGVYRAALVPGKLIFKRLEKESDVSGTYVYKIHPSKDGQVYYATDGNGLLRTYKETVTIFDEKVNPGLKLLYSVEEDYKGHIWCATAQDGLLQFDGQKFNKFSLGPYNTAGINALASIDSILIAISNQHLLMINTISGSYASLFNQTPILADHASGSSMAEGNNKEIWIGTSDGIIHLNLPLILQGLEHTVTVYEILNNNRSVSISNAKIFAESENNISFKFTSTNYNKLQGTLYSYMLEGYTKEWTQTLDNTIAFSNLRPGSYVLKLKMANAQDATAIEIPFKIKLAFYKQRWFILIVVLLLLLGIYSFSLWRLNSDRKIEKLKEEKLLFELESLKTQVNPHFLHNSFNTLINIIDTNKDDAITYVERLSDFFREILQLKNKDLVTLEEELKLATDYFYLQQKRFGEVVTLTIDVKDNSKLSLIPPLTLQLLIENAFKHNAVTQHTPLAISIKEMNNEYLMIRNNKSPKLNTEKSIGLGLENIKGRYKFFTNLPVLISNELKEFKIELPILKK